MRIAHSNGIAINSAASTGLSGSSSSASSSSAIFSGAYVLAHQALSLLRMANARAALLVLPPVMMRSARRLTT